MSFRPELLNKEKGKLGQESFLDEKSENEILDIFLEILHSGMHGFCISPYEEGQKPGDILTESQIRRRLSILQKHSQWVRSFSCTEGNELIPKIAKEMGMKTLVGAWLGDDKEKNRLEINQLIELSNQGYVDIAAVGNEVLYRKDLTEAELLEYIAEVKAAVSKVPVGYVDAYYEFVQRPAIAELSDVILCNCYPFWEGTDFHQSLSHMKNMYLAAKQAGQGKKVIITETGWPSQGQAIMQAQPSVVNALKYFINTQLWAHDENIEVFYFSSFDESWKVGAEGDVGAHWGVWDSSEHLKFINQFA
jgi:exo-beta-1,3-glucanase (GH17 family)